MLTSSQQKALDATRNLSVTANAGSGKTMVLVERVVRILLEIDDVLPEQLVAITFTDKAAAELRTKIAEALEARVLQEPENTRLRAMRADIGAAHVGTIHSFCRSLLQTYPLEASVDADFSVLDTTEADYLRQEALVETFRDVLDRPLPDDSGMRALFLRYGRAAVGEIVELVLSKRELGTHLASILDHPDDDVIALWVRAVDEALERLVAGLPLSDLTVLANAHTSAASKALQAALSAYDPALPLRERGRLTADIVGAVLTDKGTLRAALVSKKDDPSVYAGLATVMAGLKEDLKVFEFDVDDGERLARLRTMLGDIRIIIGIAQQVDERYRAKKEDRGALDFDDLQMFTVRLLDDESVRAEVQNTFRYILVDEFQDTNHLQYALLQRLTGGMTRGNLFIVGDPKQSIYGFRNADVEVFREAREAITRSNAHDTPYHFAGEPVSSTPEERKGALLLAESFRMLPGAAAFVNHVFSRLMARDVVGYDAILPARVPRDMPAAHVEWMWLPDKSDEAEAVAQRIVELLTVNTDGAMVGDKDLVRAPRARDIAILLRNRTALPALEQALFRNAIPYVIAGGIGFYGRQEVVDVMNYLRFIVTPSNDIACAAILRSPYFHVSDAELFGIARVTHERGASFWERARSYAASTASQQDALRHAVTTLDRHLIIAHRIKVTELLAALRGDTLWDASIAGHPQAEQVRANMEKLVALARDFQRRGFTSLYDFVEVLERLANDAEREGQATIAVDGDAVRVMTVHAAKGLEFPIVFLPFLSARNRGLGNQLLDRQLGLLYSKPDSGIDNTEVYRLASARAKAHSEEEERRVFYVACTRARDGLVLSHAGKAVRSSWAGQLASALDIDDPIDGIVEFPNGALTLRTVALTSTVPLPPRSDAGGPVADIETINVARLPSEPHGEFFSASHFVTWKQCPTKYVLRYLLGAPEEFRPSAQAELNGDDRIYGTARGTATHAVMARLTGENADDIESLAREEVMHVGLPAPDAEELAMDVAQLVRSVLRQPAWRTMLAQQPAFVEYELAAAIETEFVHGVIDRLVRDSDGTWHVIDYKTDHVTTTNVGLKIEHYQLQLEVYAFLVLTHYIDAPRVVTHLWFLQDPSLSETRAFVREDLPALQTHMRELLGQLTSTQDLGTQAVRRTEHCPHCVFSHIVNGVVQCRLVTS